MNSVDLNNLSIEDLRKIKKIKKLNWKKSLKSIKSNKKTDWWNNGNRKQRKIKYLPANRIFVFSFMPCVFMAKKYWVMGTGEESIVITESPSMLERKLHELLSNIFKYSGVC